MFTSPVLVRVRSIARRLGLNRWIGRLLANRRYEDRFGPALQAEVRSGDTVWDIGANLGLYTQAFVDRVSPDGCVVAFEPVPTCFAALQERFAGARNVIALNLAIGDSDGQVSMCLDEDPLAPTHRVIARPEDGHSGKNVVVAVRSAASIIRRQPELFPNLIKIDVEGHEGAVLDGMQPLLADRRLRCIGVEVHFGLLEERGEAGRPKQIEETLVRNSFRVRWTDPSHLLAVR